MLARLETGLFGCACGGGKDGRSWETQVACSTNKTHLCCLLLEAGEQIIVCGLLALFWMVAGVSLHALDSRLGWAAGAGVHEALRLWVLGLQLRHEGRLLVRLDHALSKTSIPAAVYQDKLSADHAGIRAWEGLTRQLCSLLLLLSRCGVLLLLL